MAWSCYFSISSIHSFFICAPLVLQRLGVPGARLVPYSLRSRGALGPPSLRYSLSVLPFGLSRSAGTGGPGGSGSPRLIWRVWATRLPLSGGRRLRRIPQCVIRAWEHFTIIYFPGTGISTAKPLVPLHSGTGVELGGQQGERVLSPT